MRNGLGAVAVSLAPLVVAAGCASGRGVRISERFGYDPADATRFVQAALDSGEKTLIVDKQAGDWIVRPLGLKARRDVTLVFEDGAWIVAKRGEFKNPYVAMLTFDYCTNIAIRGTSPERCGFRMWVDDYIVRGDKKKPNAKGYQFSEWRHGLSFLSCNGVTLEGISSNESGGDGLYVSTSGRVRAKSGNCEVGRDFTVRNCIFDRNNRQGISVIGVNGFLAEDVLMSNTFGTAPMSGIDFEPNRADESLTGIVMRRCRSVNNTGDGFEIVVSTYDATSAPVDAVFEDCVAISNRFGFLYTAQSVPPKLTEPMDFGRIAFNRCRFAASRENGFAFWHSPYARGSLALRDTVLENNCTQNPSRPDLALTVSAHGPYEPDTCTFENVTVIRPKPSRAIGVAKRKLPHRGRPTRLAGSIRTIAAGRESTLVFDERWNRENAPYVEANDVALPRVAEDLANVEIVDADPDRMVEVAHPIYYRGNGSVVFYADRARDVHVKLQQNLVGKRDYRAAKKPTRVYPWGSKKPLDPNGLALPTDPEGAVLTFRVPAMGFYRLDIVTGENGVAVLATDVPLAYNPGKGYVNFIAPLGGAASVTRRYREKSELHFFVPGGTDFTLQHFCGDFGGNAEMIGVEVVDPSGRVVRREPALSCFNALTFPKAAGGLWTLRAFKPEEGVFEDHDFALSGVPGWLFVTPEKYWKSARPLMMR